MSSQFPTTLDNFTNNVDNVDTIVAQDINDLNDAVEALQAKVGVDNSAVTTSIDYILKNKIYPVGSIYSNGSVSTNPAALLGFGTWTAFAPGKVIVGITASDADFNELTDTGGAKTATLAVTNLPSHNHPGSTTSSVTPHTHAGPSHQHTGTTGTESAAHRHGYGAGDGTTSSGYAADTNILSETQYTDYSTTTHTHDFTTNPGGTGNTGDGTAHTHGITVGSQGSGTAFSIMNPYVTAYCWIRTA